MLDEACLAWGARKAEALLSEAATWLKQETHDGRWHYFFTRTLANVAMLGDLPDVVRAANEALVAAPERGTLAGSITNVAAHRKTAQRPPPNLADAHDAHPPHPGPCLLDREQDPHLVLVRQARFEEARTHATTPLAQEEYASACAVVGNIGEALAFIDTDTFPADRKRGPQVVACVESWRLGDLPQTQALLDRLTPRDAYENAWLAAGFLGRMPWNGYPFPDY